MSKPFLYFNLDNRFWFAKNENSNAWVQNTSFIKCVFYGLIDIFSKNTEGVLFKRKAPLWQSKVEFLKISKKFLKIH
jgi:hypothetical protein